MPASLPPNIWRGSVVIAAGKVSLVILTFQCEDRVDGCRHSLDAEIALHLLVGGHQDPIGRPGTGIVASVPEPAVIREEILRFFSDPALRERCREAIAREKERRRKEKELAAEPDPEGEKEDEPC